MTTSEPVRRRSKLPFPGGEVDLVEQDPGYLLGTVQIHRATHHVELIEVRPCPMSGRGYRQKAVNPVYQQQLERIYAVAGEGIDRLESIRLDGRAYVLVIEPAED